MKLKELSKDELETMGYDEIACLILKESGKEMKINDLFKKVCEVLDYDDNAFTDYIADFFELLSTNKKFIMLENGYWDLQSKHQPEIFVEENDEDEFVDTDEEEDIPTNDDEDTDTSSDLFYEGDETDDVEDDDLADLVVVEEEEESS